MTETMICLEYRKNDTAQSDSSSKHPDIGWEKYPESAKRSLT
jgi:hypothetical protein